MIYRKRAHKWLKWRQLSKAIAQSVAERLDKSGFMATLLENAKKRCEEDPNNIPRIKVRTKNVKAQFTNLGK